MNEIKKVLIVDDDRRAAEDIRTSLESLGYQVMVCANGEEALRCSESRGFDFMIIDHDMPQINGLAVTRIMRRLYPFAYLIGVSRSDVCDAFLFAGANWFIHKPVTPQKLQQIFGRVRLFAELADLDNLR